MSVARREGHDKVVNGLLIANLERVEDRAAGLQVVGNQSSAIVRSSQQPTVSTEDQPNGVPLVYGVETRARSWELSMSHTITSRRLSLVDGGKMAVWGDRGQ